MESVIDRLRDIKTAKGLTNQQISEITGVPVGTIGRLFANELSDPKWTTIAQIAAGLDLDMNLLAGMATVQSGNTPPAPIARTVESIQFDMLLANSRERIEEINARHKETCEHYEIRIADLKRDKRFLAVFAVLMLILLVSLFAADFILSDHGWIRSTLSSLSSHI